MPGLGTKQAAFVREYLVDLNATQAAIRASYSPRTAEKIGSENLKKPEIARAIAEALKRRADRVEVKQDDVLRELLRIMSCDIGHAFDDAGRLRPLKEMPEDVRRVISGVEVTQLFDGTGADRYHSGDLLKVKFWDKTKAIELAGKHLALFTERHEHTGKDGQPLNVSIHIGPGRKKDA